MNRFEVGDVEDGSVGSEGRRTAALPAAHTGRDHLPSNSPENQNDGMDPGRVGCVRIVGGGMDVRVKLELVGVRFV